ncbi:glycoside hydrolase family 13 protein [Clostridium folliculivorans]|uniref:Alpha-amylase n=1 Tax=Clostridium folliculivorans TaxID=2886038 RepID=A0A9W5Y6N0_9CLOT|nr:glycoside hydrolase family 13 protein [Clostridium folliculivorans]GKU27714.1 alpha-amylase [Clostridium folliculivorans]GKU32474.1 alpha-amylase [Clostridium folliculivorans]
MNNFYILHDSQNTYYRNPFGAVKLGTEISIVIESQGCQQAFIELIHFDGHRQSILMEMFYKEGQNDICFFKTSFIATTKGVLNYYFVLKRQEQTIYYGNNNEGLGGIGQIYADNPKYYQITVYQDNLVPKWYKEGIIYQIFVDRFFNGNDNGLVDNPKKNSFIYGNWYDQPMYIKDADGKVLRWDFFGGNLKGIMKKLDYIKSLGVTTIYLNPIFESSSCHKYDTANYKNIDPMFGNDKIFKCLCSEANKYGIRIILDGVFSHTGSDSVYFNKNGNYDSLGAYQSKDSKYYEWYRFRDYPHDYESWWGFENLPNVDELNPSYMDYIINKDDSVLSKWMNLGVSGWRLDVADELPDEFIKAIKSKIKKIKNDSVLVGEVWEDASNKVSYGQKREYLYGDELDSVMGYTFRDIIIAFLNRGIDSHMLVKKFMSLYENYPKENFYASMNIIGTHDTERIITMFMNNYNDINIAKSMVKLAVAFQMTFPGVPVIYYGDEVGLEGQKDPDNRRTYPWNKEDKDILSWYKRLSGIRSNSLVLKRGELRFFDTNADVICFERSYKNSKLLVIINRNSNSSIKVEFGEVKGHYRDMLRDCKNDVYYSAEGIISVELKPAEVKLLVKVF